MSTTGTTGESRFDRLMTYLASDPENLALIADAAAAALDEGRPAEAALMAERYGALAPLTPGLINLLGLAALSEGRDADAAAIFESLLSTAADDPALRFNLAWARGRMGDHEGVLALIENGTDLASTTLAVRALHHLGHLDEALALGDGLEDEVGEAELWGALAMVAVDAEDLERARRWASKGERSVDGMAAQGLLEMGRSATPEARGWFEHALAARPDSARALMGLGSVCLEDGEPDMAARHFDAAAEVFGDHLGTWIAAGWAWLLAGKADEAARRFERVLALDDTFGEAHGGLAVLAALEGRTEDASRLADIAQRLDRQGLGGTLARSLLLDGQGETARAERLRNTGLNQPIGVDGQSIAQRLALSASRGR